MASCTTGSYGTLGEEAIVPASVLAEFPANLTTVQAASFWMPYLTAYGGLVAIAHIGDGDFVSIPAGASSVGLAAIQFVHDVGATAIAVTRTSAKKDKLLSLGTDHVVVLAEEEYVSRVQEITKSSGVRVTFDPIGGPLLEQLAAASAPGGIIVEYGRLLRDPQAAATAKKHIYDRVADGRFVPRVARTFPLENTVEAYQYITSNERIGRVVITVV
jgi:NADPH:quinone reductase-like Zn-dependent oxidoreductase